MQFISKRKRLNSQINNIIVKNALPFMRHFYIFMSGRKPHYHSIRVNKFSLPDNKTISKPINELIKTIFFGTTQITCNKRADTKIEIGNISFLIKSNCKSIVQKIIKKYKNFHSSSMGNYTGLCYLSNEDYLRMVQKIADYLSINHQEINIINCRDGKLLIILPDIIVFFNTNDKAIDILFRKYNEISFDSLLRIVFSMISIEEEGFLLHSAALKENGNGYVFFGPSQSGKSTIARFAERNYQVLSDELNIIRKIGHEFRVFGTPFIGTNSAEGINNNSCLKGLFLPYKDTRTYLKRMDKSNVLRQLLTNTLFFGCRNQLAEKLFNLCNNLIDNIPCFELHFTLDNSFLRLINDFDKR